MADATPPTVVATLGLIDIYKTQIEMQSQLAVINAKLEDLPDHEARLRVLEAAKAKIYGIAIALGALAGGGAGWIALALGRGHP
jgi:hypothetical protein